MQTPQWHFHEKSRSYVFGIKLEDGCVICEKFNSLLDEREKTHLVSVSFSEEFAEKALDRYLKKEPIFKIYEDKFKTFSGPLIKELSNPSKEDKIRWKKQFSFIMSKIRKTDGIVVEQLPEKEEEIEEALMEVRTNSKGQASLFGEVIESTKKRKK